jgi:iron complex outermembrane receptor protein
VGAGTFIVGPRQGDADNSVQLPGYVRVDAAVAYRFKVMGSVLTAQFNVQNLLDKICFLGTDTVDSAFPRADIIPGAPRSFLGSFRVEF